MRIWAVETGISVNCEASSCLLLRDNVQHHLEGGRPGDLYRAIHGLADGWWSARPLTIQAGKLRAELHQAWPLLRGIPNSRLAIGIRSRAALTGAASPPVVRGTVLLRLTGWRLPLRFDPNGTLDDLLGTTVATLMRLCERAGSAAKLEVTRRDAVPRGMSAPADKR